MAPLIMVVHEGSHTTIKWASFYFVYIFWWRSSEYLKVPEYIIETKLCDGWSLKHALSVFKCLNKV